MARAGRRPSLAANASRARHCRRSPRRRDGDGRRQPHRRGRHPRDHRFRPLPGRRLRASRSTSSTKCTCLSTAAFNALLKTLEEPPAHVKFIFATTEIRKVPVTVLSRCQRFDLKRIEPEVMMTHLVCCRATLRARSLAPDALALITRAAEGSVRDAMSLMDQAIAHGAGETSAAQVRAMLGLADRGRVLDLFDLIMKGDAATALAELAAQYADGADPMAVLRDLAEITHWISVIKINPASAEDPTTPPDEQTRGQDMAARLPMRALEPHVADALEGARRGAACAERDDGGGDGCHPPDPRRRPARSGNPDEEAVGSQPQSASGGACARWCAGKWHGPAPERCRCAPARAPVHSGTRRGGPR
jgi:hypothetical protein